jgi:hypothetical protein
MGEDGGINVFAFVRNGPVNAIDPFGLWIIERKGSAKARATAEEYDTVNTLAPLTGLAPADYPKWLSPDVTYGYQPSSADEMLCGTYEIPNTVIAYWGGDAGAIGRAWVFRGRNVRSLRSRGFLVQDVRFRSNYGGRWIEDPVDEGAPRMEWVYRGWGSSRGELQRLLKASAIAKELHGLYFWGHGWPGGVGVNDGPKFNVQIYYGRISLPYKMGLGWVHACYSNYGKSSLVSGTPGHEWIGFDSVLAPVLPGVDIDWPWGPFPSFDEGE